MVSEYDFYNDEHRSTSWEKVTKRMVDPITFSYRVHVTYVPRIEDCAHETTDIALSRPRFGGNVVNSQDANTSPTNTGNGRSNGKVTSSFVRKPIKATVSDDLAWKPRSFPANKNQQSSVPESPKPSKSASLPVGFSPRKKLSPRPLPIKSPGKVSSPIKSPGKLPSQIKSPGKLASPIKSPGKLAQAKVKPNASVPSLFASATPSGYRPPKSPVKDRVAKNVGSLGAFFSQSAVRKSLAVDSDNHSVGSRSIGSRSVSERSNAERSKAEERIRHRKNEKKRIASGVSSRSGESMMSIDERTTQQFSPKAPSGTLGKFLDEKSTHSAVSKKDDDDNKSVMSSSTMGSKSITLRSNADRSKNEKKLKSAFRPSSVKETKSRTIVSPSKGGKRSSLQIKPLKSILKKAGAPSKKSRKVQVSDDVDVTDFPKLDDDEYYKDWDDIWYTEEELGDMRYEAFLEEAGLDIDEFK